MEKIWLKSYPEKVQHEIDTSTYKSIVDAFKKSVDSYGESPSFESMGTQISFNELDKASDEFASFLQNIAGLEKGDRIAIQLPNILQFPIVLFGALKAGLIVVNTNPLYTKREMKYQFSDAQVKAIVILSNFANKLEEVIKDYPIEHIVVTELGDMLGWPRSIIVNFALKYIKKMVPKYNIPNSYSFYEALDLGENQIFNPVEIEPQDLAFLQYTGGTTGLPKGAMLSHKNIVSNILQAEEWLSGGFKKGKEIIITALPLYHIFSLTVNSLLMMTLGACNVLIANPRDIPSFIKVLKRSKFTVITGVNTLYKALLNHKDFKGVSFNSVKLCLAGGSALHKSVAEKWLGITGRKIVEGFGLTESSPIALVNPVNGSDQIGSIGLPMPSTNIKIVDEQRNEVSVGENGELCISGPQVMQGYWNKPDETAETIIDGWLYTGDIAQMQPDGFVKIVDRKKDMILVSGFNVYPNEVEDIACRHDKVLEAAAVGVASEKSGEAVKLFVVAKDKSLTEQELKDYCREYLTAYKIPQIIEFRNDLPKSNIGKILRKDLREV